MNIPPLENLKLENDEEEEVDEDYEDDNDDDDDNDDEACYYPKERTAEKEKRVEIKLSDTMKMWLENDFERITLHNKLVKLPSKPNIISILEDYFKTWTTELLFEVTEKPKRKCSYRQKKHEMHDLDSAIRIVRICREVMDGIRISFDFTLAALLLYNQERDQYNELDLSQKAKEERDLSDHIKTEFMAEGNKENDYAESSSMLHVDIIPEEGEGEEEGGEEEEEEEEEEGEREEEERGREETSNEEFSPVNQAVAYSEDSSDAEFNVTLLSCEANVSLVSIEANEVNGYVVVGSADSSPETEYLEIQPLITLNGLMNDEDNDDNDPDNGNESEISSQKENFVNFEACVEESDNYVHSVQLLTINDMSECEQNNAKRSLLPEFLTGVPRIITRSMTTNAHAKKKDEMAKTYAILSNLLEKPFVPRNEDSALPSCVYGPIHLARLFVKLPDILQTSEVSSRKLATLSQHLHRFLNYLEGHPQWFSEENYNDNMSPTVKKEPSD